MGDDNKTLTLTCIVSEMAFVGREVPEIILFYNAPNIICFSNMPATFVTFIKPPRRARKKVAPGKFISMPCIKNESRKNKSKLSHSQNIEIANAAMYLAATIICNGQYWLPPLHIIHICCSHAYDPCNNVALHIQCSLCMCVLRIVQKVL